MTEDVTDKAQAVMEEEELSPEEIQETLDQIAELDEAMAPEITDDLSAAMADEEYVWDIPTGKFTDGGKPIYLTVHVKDPCKTELPTQYIQAMQKGEDKATELLWKTCVVKPVALKNPEVQKKTASAFRSSLTYRLLGLIGVNGDFFSALAAMGSRTGSHHATRSSTSAPASTPAPSKRSSAGDPSDYSPPISSPTPDASKTDSTSSTTSGTSSQSHSAVKRPNLSSTHSSRS